MKQVKIVGKLLPLHELTATAQCDTCHSTFPRDALNWKPKVRVLLDNQEDPDHFVFASFINCPWCQSLGVCDRIMFKKRRDEC
jgi:hypothetical protein